MSIRRRLARLNRVVANPLIGRVVSATPGFGAVVHRGRRSGREYRTPVMVFRDGERYVFALPYGRESDWARNVLAAGGCDLLSRGRRVHLAEPRLREDASPGVPPFVRGVLRRLGHTEYLTLHPSDSKEDS
jgi:deazaflavin-dependent oxidoreductase (nitroreductase family)